MNRSFKRLNRRKKPHFISYLFSGYNFDNSFISNILDGYYIYQTRNAKL